MNSGARLFENMAANVPATNFPPFSIGDTVTVHFKIIEGDKEVIQRFKGIVIADKGRGMGRMLTLRHLTGGVGVERVFPLQSPHIDKIEMLRGGDVRRAKLYYIRDLKGKAASQVKEKRFAGEAGKEQ
jgi:large subunit ribosomal protein L19